MKQSLWWSTSCSMEEGMLCTVQHRWWGPSSEIFQSNTEGKEWSSSACGANSRPRINKSCSSRFNPLVRRKHDWFVSSLLCTVKIRHTYPLPESLGLEPMSHWIFLDNSDPLIMITLPGNGTKRFPVIPYSYIRSTAPRQLLWLIYITVTITRPIGET